MVLPSNLVPGMVPDQGHTCPLCGVQFVVQICGQQKLLKTRSYNERCQQRCKWQDWKLGKTLQLPASWLLALAMPWKFQGATMSGMMTRNKGRNPDSPIKKKNGQSSKGSGCNMDLSENLGENTQIYPSVSFIIFPMKLVIWNYLEAYQAYFLFRHTVPDFRNAGHRSCRKKMTGEG